MKWYISADLEGINGIVHPRQCYPEPAGEGHWQYQSAVDHLTDELTMVCGLIQRFDPEARVVINDAHSSMINIKIDALPGDVALVSGKPKVAAMMAGLDNGFDAVCLLGYHAMAGTQGGVLNHSYHPAIASLDLNGVKLGEAGLNTLWSHLVAKVPVVLGAGDRAFCKELSALFPDIKTVETKVGLTSTSAHCLSLEAIHQDYEEALQLIVNSRETWRTTLPDLGLSAPYHLTVTFNTTLAADAALLNPWFERLDGCSIRITHDQFPFCYRGLQTAYSLASLYV